MLNNYIRMSSSAADYLSLLLSFIVRYILPFYTALRGQSISIHLAISRRMLEGYDITNTNSPTPHVCIVLPSERRSHGRLLQVCCPYSKPEEGKMDWPS